MIEKIFPTEEEQKEALGALKSLVATKGWKILEDLLDKDIKKIDNELKTKDFDNLVDLKVAQDKHATRTILKELPRDLIRALQDEPTEKVELDPYVEETSKERL